MRFTVFATKSYEGQDVFKINDTLKGVLPAWYKIEDEAKRIATVLNNNFMTVEESVRIYKDKKNREYELNLISGKRTFLKEAENDS